MNNNNNFNLFSSILSPSSSSSTISTTSFPIRKFDFGEVETTKQVESSLGLKRDFDVLSSGGSSGNGGVNGLVEGSDMKRKKFSEQVGEGMSLGEEVRGLFVEKVSSGERSLQQLKSTLLPEIENPCQEQEVETLNQKLHVDNNNSSSSSFKNKKNVRLFSVENGVAGTSCKKDQQQEKQIKVRKGVWVESEDNVLKKYVHSEMETLKKENPQCRELGSSQLALEINWKKVASKIPGRNVKQCRERWCYNLDPCVNKGEWTESEDMVLKVLQQRLGNRWSFIAKMLPGRTEHTVKTRFRSIVRAEKREWKPHEDALLLELQGKFGSQWDSIAKFFPNRTKNAVSTRFKQLREQQFSSKSVMAGLNVFPHPISKATTTTKIPLLQIEKIAASIDPKNLVPSQIHQQIAAVTKNSNNNNNNNNNNSHHHNQQQKQNVSTFPKLDFTDFTKVATSIQKPTSPSSLSPSSQAFISAGLL